MPTRLIGAPQAHGGEPLIPFSGSFESKLFDMPDDEKEAYCKEVCVAPSGCALVIASFECCGHGEAAAKPAAGQ